MQIELAKKYVVEIYSDQGSLNDRPWRTLGEFMELEHAIDACKSVIDNFLMRSSLQKFGAEFLINHFLNYGDVPYINGSENLSKFDIYEYLNIRCNEISHNH
jgi:hypothetical protein